MYKQKSKFILLPLLPAIVFISSSLVYFNNSASNKTNFPSSSIIPTNETGFAKAIIISEKPGSVLETRSKAPEFQLYELNGRKIKLSDYKGSTVLLSFIYIHNSSQVDKAKATRSQLAFLKSIRTQYGEDELKIILVDEAYRDPLDEESEETLINFIYDNELEEIPLLLDNKISDVAGKYGIYVLPTTFLIAKDGTIDQIWENTALSSQLDFAIREIKGRALGPASNRDDEWSIPAQMIFPGLDAARRFSNKIWLVDGGKKWKLGDRYPVRILVLADQKVNIFLKAISSQRNESILLLDGAMEALPYDEAKMILNNMKGENSKVYSLVSSLSIEKPGRYTLQATVTETETNRTLFTGTARVTVQ